MFSLYFDEDASDRRLLRALRADGFDCLTAHEAGQLEATDEDQLAFAASHNRVLYSNNAGDFARLHREWQLTERSHSGIVVVSAQRSPIGAQLRGIRTLAERFEPEDMVNRLEFLLNYA